MIGYSTHARSSRSLRRYFDRPGPHRAPLISHFSLPGGSVEIGETMAALGRELMEEVGIETEIIAFNRIWRRFSTKGSEYETHFVIASFVVRWASDEPRLSDQVDAVDWIDPSAGLPSPTTPGLGEALMSAARIESQTAIVKNDVVAMPEAAILPDISV
jgi:ADP-ribose pyrophosphatase YjhB (NUDIX family)